jgi:hypothetical protein
MENNRVKDKKYGVYHKPTKLWVFFRETKNKQSVMICLALKPDATINSSKQVLRDLLLKGEFNSVPDYGKNNFLEFQIKVI